MIAVCHRAIHTKVVRGTNVHTVGADTAFLAVFTAAVAVAAAALGAVHTRIDSAINAYRHARLFTAVFAMFHAIETQFTFFAPAAHLEITAAALGAVSALVDGALNADDTLAEMCRAGIAYFYAIAAQAALFAPLLSYPIASEATRAVIALILGAALANIAALIIRTARADLIAGTIGANTALDAQFTTLIALIAVFAIRRTVNPLLAVRAPVPGKYRKRKRGHHTRHQRNSQNNAYKAFGGFVFH